MKSQLNQTTFNNLQMNDTIYINSAINNTLLNINTIFPAQITAIDGLRCTISPIINLIATNQPSPRPSIISNVPLCQLMGGSSGVIIQYQIGDIVLCGAIQRDVSTIKTNWQTANPASARKFSLSDTVVLFALKNSLPTNFVKITDAGIDITASGLPITVNGENVTVNDSGTTYVNAPNVKLGAGAANKLLLEGVPLTAAITGVQSGGGVAGVTITVSSGGSSTVKAST